MLYIWSNYYSIKLHLIWHLFCSGCTSHCTTCNSDWQCDECSPGYHLQTVDPLSCPGRALCIIIQQFTTMHFCFPQHLVAVHSVWCSSHLDCPDGCSTCAGSLDRECSECLPGFYYSPYNEDTGYCIGINTPLLLLLSTHPHTSIISNGRIQYFVLFHITILLINKIHIIYVFNLKCVCSAVIFDILHHSSCEIVSYDNKYFLFIVAFVRLWKSLSFLFITNHMSAMWSW